jgi:8-oxo-dGTP diphosphatase
MKKYSLGFIFNSAGNEVLLIHKNNPDWQKGKVNGIGGKIEIGESSVECIIRETKEETGLDTNNEDWIHFGQIINGDKSTSQLFYYIYPGVTSDATTQEDEEIEWFAVNNLPNNIMSNLSWLIPLALDKHLNLEVDHVELINA